MGQAADHPAGAAVQVLVQARQGAMLVAVQPQRVFEGGDQALPLAGEREREGGDEGEPAGDRASAGAGEQALALDVDARIDERCGDALGEVLQRVGYLCAAAGGELEVVYLVDFTDRRSTVTCSDLRLLVIYMSVTESAGMLPDLFRRVAGARCPSAGLVQAVGLRRWVSLRI